MREQGWAVDHEGFALGVSTVAAPIFGPDGKIALVAAAVGFTNLFTDEVAQQCGEELRRVCDRIGHILGGENPTFTKAVAVTEGAETKVKAGQGAS